MKSFYRYAFVVFLVLLFGCQQQQRTFTEVEKDAVKKEVKEQFNQLISAINKMDVGAWSQNYSKDEFLSAIAGTDYYATRAVWVDAITKNFSMRDHQKVELSDVQVTALEPNLALMTSVEQTEMGFKDGKNMKFKHVFTMIWKKEKDGWKILHSHESWLDQ
ncbi:MAG: nuclear transport factor 2 family protein [Desulfatirhabdiaceae bacterium]